MTASQKQQLRDLRRRLRQRRHRYRAALHDRLAPLRNAKRRARNRRLKQAFIIVALVTLALLSRCSCDPKGELPRSSPPAEATVASPAAPPPRPPPPLRGELARQPRTRYERAPTTEPAWLESYRLQVAARAPRLAACFSGVDKPGALRWTASVNAADGQTSAHSVEPLEGTGELPPAQRDCLLGALTSPAYKLPPTEDAPSTSPRISIVIEF